LNAVPLTAEIAVDAGTIKRPGIFVADSVIAASARFFDASVVTNDPNFFAILVVVSGYQ
jgi:predicted nucleic acid-binding protein